MTQIEDISFGYLLNDVTLLFRKHFDRRATRFGLTRAQWRAIKMLARMQGIRQSELAEHLEMEPIAVGRVIDRLQAAGFVERRADPRDRRCWRLHLTDRALAVVDDMEQIARGLRRDATREIERERLLIAKDVLTRMKENLQALDDVEGGPAPS
jgi:MarR family transcriptional regulator, transcriptional regulator for hemolysin